jgi:hypothetical protein
LLYSALDVEYRRCSGDLISEASQRVASPVIATMQFLAISVHCTVRLTVAMLLAMFGSGVSAVVAAFSVITVPDGAVTFTVSRTVHVVFRSILPFSWQMICPVPP